MAINKRYEERFLNDEDIVIDPFSDSETRQYLSSNEGRREKLKLHRKKDKQDSST